MLRLDWTTAALLGAVVSSTDAAAVFSVLRRIPLPGRLVGLLEAESGFNDAPAVILVVALTARAAGRSAHPWWVLLGEAVLELAVGAVVGARRRLGRRRAAAAGRAAVVRAVPDRGPRRSRRAAFGAADVLHGSGLPRDVPRGARPGQPAAAARRRRARLRRGDGVDRADRALRAARPARGPGPAAGPSAAGDRRRARAACCSPGRCRCCSRCRGSGCRLREQAFLAWAGLRGAVPIVLATIPLARGVPASTEIFDVVVVIVVVFTLVQGPTLPLAARLLGLAGSVTTSDLEVEAAPLGALDADVLTVRVGPDSRLHGVEIFELRLPARANVTLVVRDGEAFVPDAADHAPARRRAHRRHRRRRAEPPRSAACARSAPGGKLAGWRRPRATLSARVTCADARCGGHTAGTPPVGVPVVLR